MIVVGSREEASRRVREARARGLTIGLVPTMGYLHEGHLSLMRLARARCGFTAVSIFVNPIQFGPGEDLERYPRDLERDLALVEREGVDLVFAPPVEQMYYPDRSTVVEETMVSRGLCGRSRPGHFRGVTTVVAKLFHILEPDLAVFGRKDLQQLAVIRRMVRDLDFPVEILAGEIIREPDGLALSSRNVFLSPGQRAAAIGLQRGLREGADRLAEPAADLAAVLADTAARIEQWTGGSLEYLSAVDQAMEEVAAATGCRYLAAALRYPQVRLIDNVEVGCGPDRAEDRWPSIAGLL